MAVPILIPASTAGEVAPDLFGRFDIAKMAVALATGRNGFVGYKGGFYSRAGTKFVGFSKQTGRTVPPRLIPFQFSINQGLALEFGNLYVRFISNGAFVLETGVSITAATKASPAVLTVPSIGATSATANTGAVSVSYEPGELVTLAGGVASVRTVLSVTNTKLITIQVNSPGTIYVPAQTITLTGGTQSTPAQLTVATTRVVSATVQAGGSGGTDGTQTVTGTTGTGTKFQAIVTIASNSITAVQSISVAGSYTVNPTNLTQEPVTGAGLSNARLTIVMGVNTATISNAGVFTANASGGTFVQNTSSGSGTGATFQNAIFAPNAVAVSTAGSYTTYPTNPVAQLSTNRFGLGATFTVTSAATAAFQSGDWIYVSGVGGMTQLNGQTFVVGTATTNTVTLLDVYGQPINSTAFGTYTSGGTAAKVYTLTTPYSENDLAYLKFTQSADVMTLCCVNPVTGTEYQPKDLQRNSSTNWTFTDVVPAADVDPPGGVTVTATNIGGTEGHVNYKYQVTSIDPDDGTESIPTDPSGAEDKVNILATAGTITITWTPVEGINEYNVYKAAPMIAHNTGNLKPIPGGALYGYAGVAYGAQLLDTGIIPDFSQVPPRHLNPFARGQIISANPLTGGTSYTTVTLTINTSTGSGGRLEGVLVNGALVAVLVLSPGEGYADGDSITVTGDGSGASAALVVGPQTGTYPAVPGYFQQRRAFANSINNPDTYWMSQPGRFKNFDRRIPTIDSDAIVGSPWAVQVNGIQFLLQTPGGLIVMTGLSAWLLVSSGSFATQASPFSPSNQPVTPQAFSGCSPTVPPIKINYDIVYVGSKGSFYYDLPYQQYALSEPIDLTQFATHMFANFAVQENAWCEQPNKLLWSVRNDGVMLALTYLKQQEVAGWTRHDTNGLFKSVCSIVEPPVDALYIATQRFPGVNTAYMIERMDNRAWETAEEPWCVDCALQLAMTTPAATLRASSATGLGAVTAATGTGGTGYSSATTATVVDEGFYPNGPAGPGTGAVATVSVVAGVVGISFSLGNRGTGYIKPRLDIVDPAGTGSGASFTLTLDNSMTFTASAAIFSGANVGSVIRFGGGVAVITATPTTTTATANIRVPITELIANTTTPKPQTSGNWTMTAPVTTISGLNHLIGASVTGLADGNVITPRTVSATGTITLDSAASFVTVGLGFTAQMQTVYLNGGEPTMQGQRKKIGSVTARLSQSRGLQMGSNQPDGSTQNPIQVAPAWGNLTTVPDDGPNFPYKPFNSTFTPLRTGDVRLQAQGGANSRGQVCLQQSNPLPMNVLALVPEDWPGDTPQVKAGGG